MSKGQTNLAAVTNHFKQLAITESLKSRDIQSLDFDCLVQLIRSPYVPTSHDAFHIRRRINRAEFRLEHLVGEYNRAKQRKGNWKILEKQNRIRAEIALLRGLLSPIRRLYDDVLMEIFFHLRDSGYTFIEISDWKRSTEFAGLWTLTEVSSHWRRLATSMPRLWTSVVLDFRDKHDTKSPHLDWYCMDFLLSLCLERSCGLPISLFLDLDVATEFRESVGRLQVQERVQANFHRWKKLSFVANEADVANFMPSHKSLPDQIVLDDLEICIHLSIMRTLPRTRWSQLKRLKLEAEVKHFDLISLLTNLSNVVELDLALEDIHDITPLDAKQVIAIPSLLTFTTSNPSSIEHVINHLCFPNLTAFWIKVEWSNNCDAFLPLLRRSCCPLERFRASGETHLEDWIVTVIREFPTIKSLYCFPEPSPTGFHVYEQITDTLSEKDTKTGNFLYLPDLLRIGLSPTVDDTACQQSAIEFLHQRLKLPRPFPLEIYVPLDTQQAFHESISSNSSVKEAFAMRKGVIRLFADVEDGDMPHDGT